MDQACQTDLPFAIDFPQVKSIPLAHVQHAVFHDHSYASTSDHPDEQNADVRESVQAKKELDFIEMEIKCNEEQSDDEWLPEMSESDESEFGDDPDSDFFEEIERCDTKSKFRLMMMTVMMRWKRSPATGLKETVEIFMRRESL